MGHQLTCTGTTGQLVENAISKKMVENASTFQEEEKMTFNLNIIKLKSGPFGGDQQLVAMIADGNIDILIFFWDPMQPHPHDVDVKVLLRISVLYNIPTACNRSTADFIISSPLMNESYIPTLSDYSRYLDRPITF